MNNDILDLVKQHGIQHVPPSTLKQHPKNPRKGNVNAIVESIRNNGWHSVIIVQKSSGFIIAGNHRTKAAMILEMETVPVCVADVDDVKALEMVLADNRTSDIASYNMPELTESLTYLADLNRLVNSGYDQQFLDNMTYDWKKNELPAKTKSDQKSNEVDVDNLLGDDSITCPRCGFEFEV